MFTHIVFFLVGVFQDIFITYYYQTISKGYAVRSGIASTLVTIINLIVLSAILSNIGDELVSVIIAYALGNGVGTFLVVKNVYLHIIDKIKKMLDKK